MENRIFKTRSVGMGSRLTARHRTIVPVLFPGCFEGSFRGHSSTFDLESGLELVILALIEMVYVILAVRAISVAKRFWIISGPKPISAIPNKI